MRNLPEKSPAGTRLADPRDKIDLFNRIPQARDISTEEDSFDRVAAILRDILQQDFKVIEAWFMLGNVHASHGNPRDAIEYSSRRRSR